MRISSGLIKFFTATAPHSNDLSCTQLLIHARKFPVLVSAGGFKDFSRDFFGNLLENRKTVCMRASQLFCLLVTSKKSNGLYGFIRLVVLLV